MARPTRAKAVSKAETVAAEADNGAPSASGLVVLPVSDSVHVESDGAVLDGVAGGASGEHAALDEQPAVVAAAHADVVSSLTGQLAVVTAERDDALSGCLRLQGEVDAGHNRECVLRAQVDSLQEELSDCRRDNARLLLAVNRSVISVQEPLPRGSLLLLHPQLHDLTHGSVDADPALFSVHKHDPRVFSVRPAHGAHSGAVQEYFRGRGYAVVDASVGHQ